MSNQKGEPWTGVRGCEYRCRTAHRTAKRQQLSAMLGERGCFAGYRQACSSTSISVAWLAPGWCPDDGLLKTAHSLLPVSAARRPPAAEACFRPWRGYVHSGQPFPYEGRAPPTSSRFHVITLLRQSWQRASVRSGIRRRPCLPFAAASSCLMRLLKLPA